MVSWPLRPRGRSSVALRTTTEPRDYRGELMPLTPEDVHKKTFTPVRLREGYDMGEVDQFLDEVETELIRLQQENEELRTKLATASTAAPSAPTSAVATPAADKPAHGQPAVEVPPLPVVKTVPEAS